MDNARNTSELYNEIFVTENGVQYVLRMNSISIAFKFAVDLMSTDIFVCDYSYAPMYVMTFDNILWHDEDVYTLG
jgi:hypothetical protein